jgi:hypothetical protein
MCCGGGGERGFGPGTDLFPLMLGDGREHVHREPIRHRHVRGNEVDAAVHQRRDKRDIARQPVELGHDQRGASSLRVTDRRARLRSVRMLPALDLAVLGQELPAAAIEVIGDGLALPLDAETGMALLIGRDPEVGFRGNLFFGDELRTSANIGKYQVCPNMRSYRALSNFSYCLYSRS